MLGCSCQLCQPLFCSFQSWGEGIFSSQLGSQEWQSHSVPLVVTEGGSHVEKTCCRDPVTGWVTPAGCGKLWALWATKWLFRARLDLASLSRGVEARAGALKVFTGMLAGLQVSELGKVPLKSPWKILLLWDRKQRLPAGENRFVKELWGHSLVVQAPELTQFPSLGEPGRRITLKIQELGAASREHPLGKPTSANSWV